MDDFKDAVKWLVFSLLWFASILFTLRAVMKAADLLGL